MFASQRAPKCFSRKTTTYSFRPFIARSSFSLKIKRGTQFSKLEQRDLDYFTSVLGKEGLITDKDDLESLNVDWLKKYRGESQLALFPKTTAQVSQILKYCNDRTLAVVPQGGNTGLVGGSVPVFDEIILSLSSMNKVISFDPVSGVVVCQAGLILKQLEDFLEKSGYTVPLDLGAKGSCHIGGNVSTNAGGLRLLRYGSLHGSVLGLEAVLADGKVLNNLTTLRKDNTGYDLKQLFIGSEGTLGVITAVSIMCPVKPRGSFVALLGCKDMDTVRSIFIRAKAELNEILSAYEFMDQQSLDLSLKHQRKGQPFDQKYPFYVLIETSGSNLAHDLEKLNTFLENIMNDGMIENGTVSQDQTQAKDLWRIREVVPEAILHEGGCCYKYDISLPLPDIYDIVNDTKERMKGKGVVIGYGHLGDANLHLNVAVEKKSDEVEDILEPWVYEWTAKKGGSISAEHGLGLMKANYISYSKSDPMVELMKSIKTIFDPKGILNPYKVLPK